MNPERWKRVDQILQQALSQPPASVKSLLDEACAGDEDLRREVESLIEHDRRAAGFIDALAPASIAAGQAEQSHPDFVGRTLLHYRILEKIGEGGMGVVYLAEDSHLKRSVAIKLLPPEKMNDPERKKRFIHEARAASALNHPSIVTIYDISNSDGIDFIAMEYVAGKPLAQLISDKGLPLPETLQLAIQIADALGKAHKAGIIHRDLKPSNIVVTDDNLVKILDFGLAKLVLPPQEGPDGAARSSESLTESGAIVGTSAYMSPEQAEGKNVDARSDIFSFGAVLYEMVTGRRAFKGDSIISTLAAVLHTDPEPVCRITSGIPQELERIIIRCLKKEPDHRFQRMDDVKVALLVLKEDSDKIADVQPDPKRLKLDLRSGRPVSLVRENGENTSLAKGHFSARRWAFAALGISCVLLAGLYVTWWALHRPAPPSELKQRKLTANISENLIVGGMISPDGKSLIYGDTAGSYIKLIGTGEDRALPRPAGIAPGAQWGGVSWFPDGTRIVADVVEAGGRSSAWVVSTHSGDALRIRENAKGWGVSPDGSRIVYTTGGPEALREVWIAGPRGENPQKVRGLDGNTDKWGFQWSPDGRRLAYNEVRFAPGRLEFFIKTCALDGGEPAVVVADPQLAAFCWIPQGYIVYSRRESPDELALDGNLWKISVDTRTGEHRGDPIRITNWSGFQIDGLACSADGKRLTFSKTTFYSQVYVGVLEISGTSMNPPRQMTFDESFNLPAGWTADGKAALYWSDRNGSWGVYKQAVGQTTAQVLATAADDLIRSVDTSPDGNWVLYVTEPRLSGSSTPSRVMRVPVAGGPTELVFESKNISGVRCAKAPAALCVVMERGPGNDLRTFTSFDPLKGKGSVLKTIKTDPGGAYNWSLTDDGSTLAFFKMGEREAHAQLISLSGGKDREIVAKGWGGFFALNFAPDGKALYCGIVSSEGATLLRVDMEGRAQVLWRQKGSTSIWAVPSPDGRYLAIQGRIENRNIWMLEGF